MTRNGATARWGALTAGLLLIAVSTRAQVAPTPPGTEAVGEQAVGQQALVGLQLRPRVHVSLRNQITRDVTEPIELRVQISNFTDKDIYISDVKIVVPGALLRARGIDSLALGKRDTGGAARQDPGQEARAGMLKPGFDVVVFETIPGDSSPIYRRMLRAGLVLFLPGRYEIPVTVIYGEPLEPTSELDGSVTIDLEPPLMSILMGGILGSLLLACFVNSFRFLREQGTIRIRDLLKDVIVTATAGAVCAVIALLLLVRLKDANLPLQITVTDFVGGVVVGLFTFKLGDWLHRQLGIAAGKNDSLT